MLKNVRNVGTLWSKIFIQWQICQSVRLLRPFEFCEKLVKISVSLCDSSVKIFEILRSDLSCRRLSLHLRTRCPYSLQYSQYGLLEKLGGLLWDEFMMKTKFSFNYIKIRNDLNFTKNFHSLYHSFTQQKWFKVSVFFHFCH